MNNDYIRHRLQGTVKLREIMLKEAADTAELYGTLAGDVWTDGAGRHASTIMNLGIVQTEYMDRLAKAYYRIEVLSCALHLMEHDRTLTSNQAIAKVEFVCLEANKSVS